MPPPLFSLPLRVGLPNVIAVVGSDGAGKSTLCADLVAALAKERPTAFAYLGQSSGNILAAILRVPLAGPAIGRYLKGSSTRAHGKGGSPAAPDAKTALVIHLLSRWRLHKFRHVVRLDRRGTTVVVDRWPQAEVPGFWFDGPGLDEASSTSPSLRSLARREARLYRRMAAYIPALVVRLDIDAETAHARKPDHKLPMLRDKARVIPTIGFNGAAILALDGREPYAKVLAAALAGARKALA